MEILHDLNAVIRYIKLPRDVNAFTIYKADDGTYNIYVNNLLTEFGRKKAIKHEIEHIEKGHFDSKYLRQSVSQIEREMA